MYVEERKCTATFLTLHTSSKHHLLSRRWRITRDCSETARTGRNLRAKCGDRQEDRKDDDVRREQDVRQQHRFLPRSQGQDGRHSGNDDDPSHERGSGRRKEPGAVFGGEHPAAAPQPLQEPRGFSSLQDLSPAGRLLVLLRRPGLPRGPPEDAETATVWVPAFACSEAA